MKSNNLEMLTKNQDDDIREILVEERREFPWDSHFEMLNDKNNFKRNNSIKSDLDECRQIMESFSPYFRSPHHPHDKK